MTSSPPPAADHQDTADLPPAHGWSGALTYGITPPKRSWDPERIAEVAARQSARIRQLPIDGLVIYDLQDESARTQAQRPFPFEPCIDPVAYGYDHLAEVEVPRIAYRCVAPLPAPQLRDSLTRLDREGGSVVLVGAAARDQQMVTSLPQGQALRREVAPGVPTGGVLIAERHRRERSEHLRVLRKLDQGVSFFVTQAVYAAQDTKDVLSDLARACEDAGRPVPPVSITLTPCGSEKTLTFLRWLGISVPWWLENELLTADDTLARSVEVCTEVFADLHRFAARWGITLGANVESVSLRRDEIDASVALVGAVAEVLRSDRDR